MFEKRPISANAMRFPGLFLGASAVIIASWCTSVLAIWGEDRLNNHLPDLSFFLIGRPILLLAFLAAGVTIWSFALRIRWKESLATGWQWMIGFSVLPAIVNVLFRAIHLSTLSFPYVGGRAWLLELVSSGWYPAPLATPGTLITVLAVSWFIGWTVWTWREQKTRAVLMGIASYVAFMLLLSIPSFLGWLGLDATTSWWSAGSTAVQRGLIGLSNQRYWWQALYDRFPGTTAGEVETSAQLLFSVLGYLALAGIGAVRILKEAWQQNRGVIKEYFLQERGYMGSLLVFGFLLGTNQLIRASFGLVGLLLGLVALWVGVFSLRALQAFQRKEEEKGLYLLAAFVGAWFLGWPVFVGICLSFIAVFLQERPELEGRMLLQTGLMAFRGALLFLAAWAVGSQMGSFLALPLGPVMSVFLFTWGTALAARCISSRSFIWSEGRVAALLTRGTSERVACVLILLSYGVLPFLSGWIRWALLAYPLALIAALLLFGRAGDRERRLWQVATAFWLVSYFFLQVSGFPS